MLPLDLRSTLVFSGVVDIVFAIALFLLWQRDRHRYLPEWSGGYGALALGQLLIAARGYIPDLASIVAANAAIVLGTILLYFGSSAFYARRPGIRAAWAIFAASTAGVAWFTYGRTDINVRLLIVSMAQLTLLAMLLAQFFVPRRPAQLSGSALAICFIGLSGVTLIGRCVWTLTHPAVAGFPAPTSSLNAIVLIQSLCGVGLGLGLCSLHAATLIEGVRESERRLAEANESLTQLTVRLEMRNTEYAQARDFAEAASLSKSQFLANMSHELRTPLNAIIGFSEMIRDAMLGPIGNAGYRDYATDINRSGMHLLQLVTDILDMSRAEAGHLALNEEICDPARVIDGSISMIRDQARHGQVAIEVAPLDDSPWLFADERRLRQILINLLSNAIKFTLPGGRVSVSLAVDPAGDLAFAVEDSGIGMSDAHIEIALTPFGQVDSRLNRQYEGAGLGLPLTRQLVDLHDGTLEISSRLDLGTRVVARFPAYRIRSRQV